MGFVSSKPESCNWSRRPNFARKGGFLIVERVLRPYRWPRHCWALNPQKQQKQWDFFSVSSAAFAFSHGLRMGEKIAKTASGLYRLFTMKTCYTLYVTYKDMLNGTYKGSLISRPFRSLRCVKSPQGQGRRYQENVMCFVIFWVKNVEICIFEVWFSSERILFKFSKPLK